MESEETKKLAKAVMYLLLEKTKTERNTYERNTYKSNYPFPYDTGIYTVNKKEKFALIFGVLLVLTLISLFILLLFVF